MNQDKKNKPISAKDLAVGALVGGAVGAAAGLLLAPKSGKETREDIKNKANEVATNVKQTVKKGADNIKMEAEKFRKKNVEPVVDRVGGKVEEVGKKMQS